MIYRILLAAVFLCLISNEVRSESPNPESRAYTFSVKENEIKDNTSSFEPFKEEELEEKIKLAETTDKASVQYTIGYMYNNGMNVARDYKKAEYFYLKAAKLGYVPAMLSLGRLYKETDTALGLARNPVKAFSWLSKAAKQKDPYAWYELGILYENGDGVFQNYKSSFNAYKIAAEGGVINAHAKLGMFYHKGKGIKPDIESALKHYKILADSTDNPTIKKQVELLMGGIYLEIAEKQSNNEDIAKYLELAANLGDVTAQTRLASAYAEGTGVWRDYTRAIEFYKMAAAQGNVYAMESLGHIYTNGLGVPQDYVEALKWYKLAAERGSKQATWNIGNFYLNGYGVKQDRTEAYKWFDRSKK